MTDNEQFAANALVSFEVSGSRRKPNHDEEDSALTSESTHQLSALIWCSRRMRAARNWEVLPMVTKRSGGPMVWRSRVPRSHGWSVRMWMLMGDRAVMRGKVDEDEEDWRGKVRGLKMLQRAGWREEEVRSGIMIGLLLASVRFGLLSFFFSRWCKGC